VLLGSPAAAAAFRQAAVLGAEVHPPFLPSAQPAGDGMSYCTTATCLAHRQRVFIMIWWKQWVHTNCFPCEALEKLEIAEGDLS
jgi:hypothetical protein